MDFALTTFDNPFSPFTQFDEWWNFDLVHHYRTCELLASFSNTNVFQSEQDYEDETLIAMFAICELLPETYKVVRKDG